MFGFRDMDLTTPQGQAMYKYTQSLRDPKLERPVVTINGKLTNVNDISQGHLDATAPNNMADAIRHAFLSVLDRAKGVSENFVIGMSSKMNYYRKDHIFRGMEKITNPDGTVYYKERKTGTGGVMTYQFLGETAPYNEWAKMMQVTGADLLDVVANNVFISEGQAYAEFNFSENVRFKVTPVRQKDGSLLIEKTKDADGKTKERVKISKVEGFIQINDAWAPIDPDATYYLAGLYHMLGGYFEGLYFRSKDFGDPIIRLDSDPVRNNTYKMMKNYYEDLGKIYNTQDGRIILE